MKALASRMAAAMQGLSGDSIAILFAVGVVLGTFPVYGCPTGLCLLAALVFRLNVHVLQLVNQLASPVQLALLIPFTRLGGRILGSHSAASSSTLLRFRNLTLQAIVGWLCVSVPLGLLLYVVLSRVLRGRRPACCNELENPA